MCKCSFKKRWLIKKKLWLKCLFPLHSLNTHTWQQTLPNKGRTTEALGLGLHEGGFLSSPPASPSHTPGPPAGTLQFQTLMLIFPKWSPVCLPVTASWVEGLLHLWVSPKHILDHLFQQESPLSSILSPCSPERISFLHCHSAWMVSWVQNSMLRATYSHRFEDTVLFLWLFFFFFFWWGVGRECLVLKGMLSIYHL